ncbi:MAG: hypothetical protein NVSMB45_05950 [Ginsengibacter sp.]
MANQSSINEIQGTIGNLTYYKHKRGYKVRRKTSLSRHKIMNDPRMSVVRDNMLEFAHSAKAGALLRHAVKEHLVLAKDSFLIPRLLKALRLIVNTDPIHDRGKRRVNFGDLSLLKGFDFNIEARFESIFQAPFISSIDRATGVMQIDIAPFVSSLMLRHPLEVTHFRLISSGCEVDFKNEFYKADNQTSGYYAMDNSLTPAISLTHNVRPDSSLPLFHMLGVHYFELVNGKYYPIESKTFNAFGVIGVNKV